MKGRIIQHAKLYLQKGGEEKVRHITTWDIYEKICEDLGMSVGSHERTFMEELPPKGKPITEWPEEESEYKVGPVRLFYNVPPEADFQRIKDMGATTIQTYGPVWLPNQGEDYLKKADDCGLKVLYYIKAYIHDLIRGGKSWNKYECQRVVERFTDHPALWAWALYNELDAGVEMPSAGISFAVQKEVHDHFREWTDKPLVSCVRGGTIGWHTVDMSLLDVILPDTYVYNGTGKIWGMEPLEALDMVGRQERDYLEENEIDIPSMFIFQCCDAPAVEEGNHDTKVPLGEIENQFNALKGHNVFSGGLALWGWNHGYFGPMSNDEMYEEIRELFDKIQLVDNGLHNREENRDDKEGRN